MLVLVPLRRLLTEQLHAGPDLAKDVNHAHDLGIGVFQACEGFFASHLQTPRAGGVFDHGPSVRWAQREYLIGKPLTDDNERVVGEVRAGEEVLKITKTDARAIDQILRVAVLEHTTTDFDLRVFDR